MKNIIIVGGGGNAKVLISIIKKIGEYKIIGYTDKKDRGQILNVKYLGNDNVLNEYKNKVQFAIVGIGKINESSIRLDIQNDLEQIGFEIPVIISPSAIINEDVVIDKGTIIFDGVIINSGSEIGKACILNTRSVIEHDCTIGNNVSIAPGTIINGTVNIGNNSFIGSGSLIAHSIKITSNCIIGAGAVVVNDCDISGTYIGTPARKIK